MSTKAKESKQAEAVGGSAHVRPCAAEMHEVPRHPVLRLQQKVGNQATGRLLQAVGAQAKLRVSQPGDSSEQEADRIAEQVMRSNHQPGASLSVGPAGLQRKCTACAAGGATCPKCGEEEKLRIQRKATPASTASVHAAGESVPDGFLSQLGRGRALDPALQSVLESRFGYDFSGVRIHTGSRAAESARAVNALAFTLGHDIVFGRDQYAPHTDAGQRLLSHELAHISQQVMEPTVLRATDKHTAKPEFSVGRNSEGELVLSGVYRAGDTPESFIRRLELKYLRWRFDALPPILLAELMEFFEKAVVEEESDVIPQAGESYSILVRRVLEHAILRHYKARSGARVARPAEEKRTGPLESKLAGVEVSGGPLEEGSRVEPGAKPAEKPVTPEKGEAEETVPAEVRDFYEGSTMPEAERIPVEELKRMYLTYTRFVKGDPKWGEGGESFKAWVVFLEKNAERLSGRIEATRTGKLKLEILERLMEKLEKGEKLEFPSELEKELAKKARKALEEEGAAAITGRPEWWLLPAEDRRLLLEMMEKYPDLFRDMSGTADVKKLTAGMKQTLALQISAKYIPGETGAALLEMAKSPAFWAILAGTIAIYVGLWLAPEPFSKIAATVLTAFLLLYFGIDTIISFARAWSHLEDTCRYDARTGAELEEAAKKFAKEMGEIGAQVLVAIALWLVGRAAGKAIRGVKGKGVGKAPPVGESKAPPLPEGKPPAIEGKAPAPEAGKGVGVEEAKAPPAEAGKGTAVEEGKIPAAEEGKAPPVEEGKVPTAEKGKPSATEETTKKTVEERGKRGTEKKEPSKGTKEPVTRESYKPCFLASTLVDVGDGSRPIESVLVGDRVLGRMPEANDPARPHKVLNIFGGRTDTIVRVEVGEESIATTRHHSFYVRDLGWVQACRLRCGDMLETPSGRTLAITAVSLQRYSEPVATFNLTVDEVAAYFVCIAGTSVLVHNGGSEPPSYNEILMWLLGKSPKLRPTDTDGLSLWKTSSRADVNKFMEIRVKGVDARPLNDPHSFWTEAEFNTALERAGLKSVKTPGEGALKGDFDHFSIRPAEASSDAKYKLNADEMKVLESRLKSLPESTRVKPVDLHGTC